MLWTLITTAVARPSFDVAWVEAQLGAGRPGVAIGVALDLARATPSDRRARALVGRSLVGLGRCDEALALLADRPGGTAALLDEAACHLAGADPGTARSVVEEALALDPRSVGGWEALARIADAAGDAMGAAAARDRLLALPGGIDRLPWIDAEVAVDRGDPGADAAVFSLARAVGEGDPSGVAHLARLDGIRWLDLGWPEAAADALLAAVRLDLGDPMTAAWRAEALRRGGDPLQAAAGLSRPRIASREPTAWMIAVHVRIAVDLGDLDGAQRWLDVHPNRSDPDALASAWYLGVARGDDVSALHRRYVAAQPNPSRRLDALGPR